MITSLQNPLVRYVRRLQHKASFRRKEKKFVVEGRREVQRAMTGGYCLEKLIVCPAIDSHVELREKFVRQYPRGEIVEVEAKVYEAMAYRGGTEGVLAVGCQKNHFAPVGRFTGRSLVIGGRTHSKAR